MTTFEIGFFEYRREVWGEMKKGEPKMLKQEEGIMKITKVEHLLGDERAVVAKHHNRKLGLKWGAASAGASCTVTLTCGQTKPMIRKAGRMASRLAVKMVDEDMEIASEWLDAIAAELPEE